MRVEKKALPLQLKEGDFPGKGRASDISYNVAYSNCVKACIVIKLDNSTTFSVETFAHIQHIWLQTALVGQRLFNCRGTNYHGFLPIQNQQGNFTEHSMGDPHNSHFMTGAECATENTTR